MSLYIFTFIYFVLFLAIYLQDRRRILNGFLFFILLVLLGLCMVSLFDLTQNVFLFTILAGLVFLLFFIIVFGAFILWIVSVISSIVLIKKEGFQVSNLLGILLAIGMVVWFHITRVTYASSQLNELHTILVVGINACVFYLLFVFSNYILSSFLYQFYHPILKHKYIIVLGAGLLNGNEVSHLLGSRIDRAIEEYNRQNKKANHSMKIIMSGGQGEDETCSEAFAMKEYAMQKGIPESDILLEDKSKNTYENMLFSKALIESKEEDIKKCRILFSTSNYHVFRAGLYAKKVRLKAQGVGAHTKFYFWYNAMLREFAAILSMHKKANMVCILLLLILVYALMFLSNNPEFVSSIYSLVQI